MPRYFFHIRRGEETILDDEGCEFDNFEAARDEAVLSCLDLAAQEIRGGGSVTFCDVEIWDECGKLLETIRAREIFEGR